MSLSLSVPSSNTTAVSQAATARAPAASPATPSRNRDVIVWCYIIGSLLALIPGLALKYGFDIGLTGPMARLNTALSDIRFGSGLRFWLGVTGASMMALLILYPLRKAFVKTRALGSVATWFHIHMLFGLIGPVLILYHSNFGHGGSNANVALWSMLVVAGSGIIGYFVYARASRDFYAATEQARRHRDTILSALPDVDPISGWKQTLIGKLEGFEAELLTPRLGVIASLRARWRVEHWKREILHDIAWIVVEVSRRQAFASDADSNFRMLIGGHARAYFSIARSAASRSVREQLWARWRLFHLPVFLMMIIATVLHVIAVWDMDAPEPVGAAQQQQRTVPKPAIVTQTTEGRAAPKLVKREPVDPVEALLRASERLDSDIAKPLGTAERATPVATAQTAPAPRALDVAVDTASAVQAASAAGLSMKVVKTQDLSASPAPAPRLVEAIKPVPPLNPAIGNGLPKLVTPPSPVVAPVTATVAAPVAAVQRPVSDPIKVAAPVVRPAAVPSPIAAPVEMKTAAAEPPKAFEAQPMALGAAKPRTLDDQLATLKARQKAGQFAHSQAETGFALTGKHIKVDCADCHKKPLAEAPSSNPRQCIACHKQDDVHKGRRPDCANCHTTNRWSQILRRK